MGNLIADLLGVSFLLTIVLQLAAIADGAGAGRAFTVKMENYAIKQFQKINPKLEWDQTNFLVDLSGQHVSCRITIPEVVDVKVDYPTDNVDIVAVFDSTTGIGNDVNSVNVFVLKIFDRWMASRQFHPQIRAATRFGCSVNPGCGEKEDKLTLACLFSSADNSPQKFQKRTHELSSDQVVDAIDYSEDLLESGPDVVPEINLEPTNQPHPITELTEPPTDEEIQGSGETPLEGTDRFGSVLESNEKEKGDALDSVKEKTSSELIQVGGGVLAFTPEQYSVAEQITGNKWDPSHYLENLSGFETNCGMIEAKIWPFSKARSKIAGLDLHIAGAYGHTENVGSTPNALEAIVKTLKSELQSASKVGCSLIPDCVYGERLFVVISCIYETHN